MSDKDILQLSNSTIKAFKTCRRKWYLTYYERLGIKPSRRNPTGYADLGTRVHLALEAYYGYGLDPLSVLGLIYQWACEEYPSYAEDLEKEQSWSTTMVDGYLIWAAENGVDAGLEVIATERMVSRETQLPDGRSVDLVGKLDQLIRREWDGAVLTRDWKPQPLTESVLTPSGWVTMGSIEPGDTVCGAHGEPVRVVRVYDRGVDDVYKINLNDGTHVRATSDHPWIAQKYWGEKYKIVSTDNLNRGAKLKKFEPYQDEVGSDTPVDPYLLGSWISNGDRWGRISDGIPETLEESGLTPRKTDREGKSTLYESVIPISLRRFLEKEDLLMTYSRDRFIPQSYIHGTSFRQRLSLLHGLMDGDGYFDGTRRSSAYYSTVSRNLAGDVAALVRSLGGWAKLWENPKPKYTGSVEYRVIIRSDFNPFRVCRHAEAWEKRKLAMGGNAMSSAKIVVSVEFDSKEPVRCIELDSEDKLYVTSNYTVTHNTVGTLTKADKLLRDEQMRFYTMLQALTCEETGQRSGGVLYTMLLRSKRTARAKGPFYDQVEVNFNRHDLNSMYLRTLETAREILDTLARLNAGEDHKTAAYPNPDMHCDWCPFATVCHMADDGSRFEDIVRDTYDRVDPWAYYGSDSIIRVLNEFNVDVPSDMITDTTPTRE